jgi:hypothetical protein
MNGAAIFLLDHFCKSSAAPVGFENVLVFGSFASVQEQWTATSAFA